MIDSILQQTYEKQAGMLANRVKKRYRHLRKRFVRLNIEVFRLYDWDIPEIRAVVDWYGGHLVVGEYTRTQSTPEWLPMMAAAAAKALDIGSDKVHLKARFYGKNRGKHYQRIAHTDKMIVVRERDLKFYVNPWDFVDTGLFSDHRNTRQIIREAAAGKDFLNLFCYTGSFTCYAAKGGARSTVSVDRSRTAISWARQNLELNGFAKQDHRMIQNHVVDFLHQPPKNIQKFDLAMVDPPSFYTIRSRNQHFDIATDHPDLINSVAALMREAGTIYFSTNHQAFDLHEQALNVSQVEEITSQTIPEDYRNKRKKIHRCWKIKM
ncbi:MAG: class I SAM-dependent methyltransferase [Desulfobacteraceae bacterium]|jgi:23S rRNA (cytosine1962-C5)-methyltransferase